MKKILAMLMVSLILVCSMGALTVSAAYDIDVDGNGEVNVVVMGGYEVHHYTDDINPWYKRLFTLIEAYTASEDNVLYGKTANLYTVGEETDTSFEGAMVRVDEALALNPDLVILNYSSDFRYEGMDQTPASSPSTLYIEKIVSRFAECENVPYMWQISLPNKNTGYNRNAQAYAVSRWSLKTSTFISSAGGVQELQSQSIAAAECWDENGDLTWEGHKRIGTALQSEWKANWLNGTAIKQPVVADNGPYISGNAPVYGTFRAANTAVASEGFEAQADGSMVSTAADATLTFTLTGRNFGVVHDLEGADYEIKIGGANYQTVDASKLPVYLKSGYSNTSYKVIIKASDAGVKIKGFYDSPMTINGAAYADGTVSATVLNSSLTSSDTAYAMVVYYGDNNKLVSCAPVTMTTAANANKAAISAAAHQSATKAKIMIWKTKEGAIPMCDATDYIAIN